MIITQKAFIGLLLVTFLLGVTVKSDNNCYQLSEVKTAGTGQVSVNADVAIIYAYVTKDGATVAQALSNAETVINAIDSVLAQNKLPQSAIQTSYLSIYPKYDYTTGTGVINGYTVYISLTVTILGIDKNQNTVGTVIEGLANAGVSSVSGITYDVQDKDKYATAARKAAFANALKKANQYAAIVHGKIGKLLKIDESGLTYYPYYTSSATGNSTGALGFAPAQSSESLMSTL